MNISNKASLDAAIQELESKRKIQEADLIAHFKITRESLNPIRLIKEGFHNFTAMPDFKDGFIKTVAGLGVGILSKKLFIGRSSSIIKRLLAPVLELVVAKTTINNSDKIKSFGASLFSNLFKHKKKSNQDHMYNNSN